MKPSLSALVRENEAKFVEDDYDTVNEEFFGELRKTRDIASDLSGWLDTCSQAEDRFPARWPAAPNLQKYRVDDGAALEQYKQPVLDLLSAWESRDVPYDACTLCGSATAGSLITLAVLHDLGIRTVVFETPAYYATLDQARILGMQSLRIPTYAADGFRLDVSRSQLPREPVALWITHPRVSLGLDQDPTRCLEYLESLGAQDYLVVDEATEQRFPSLLREAAHGPRVIRIRNLFKPMGLNGPRLCMILHPAALRQRMEFATATFGGPLDCFSLELAADSARDVPAFRALLEVANAQTTRARREAQRLLRGSRVGVTELVNGYIGCAVLDLTWGAGSPADNRRAFLAYCRSVRMPVILGSQMSFAADPGREFVRINYFTHGERLRAGLLLLRDFMR